jgi:hypothetical protein
MEERGECHGGKRTAIREQGSGGGGSWQDAVVLMTVLRGSELVRTSKVQYGKVRTRTLKTVGSGTQRKMKRNDEGLFGGPVGGFVVAVGGELVRLGAVGEHGPDLAGAAAGGFEDDVAAVRSPTGTFVAAHVAGEFEDAA